MTKRFVDERSSDASPLTASVGGSLTGDPLETGGPASTARNPDAHLSEEEIVGVILDDLPAAVALAVSLHLDHCESCADVLVRHEEACAEFDRSYPSDD
jgi:hypothetical protein